MATSWTMMSLRGVSSEGNATMRLLFENRNLSTLLVWLAQQYVYLGLAAAAILLYFLSRLEGPIAHNQLSVVVFCVGYAVVISMNWLFAALRLYYGPPSNVVTILLPYGEVIALTGAAVLFILVFWAMLSDLRLASVLRSALHHDS